MPAYRPSARPGRASCRASRSTSRATSRSQRVLVAPGRLLDQLGRDPRTTTSDRRECAPFGPIVGHEEVLDLGQHAVGHVSDGLHRWPDLRRLRGRDQPVVADRFAPLGLLGLDDAKHPGRDQTAREGGFFSQDQDIQGIAVLHPGAWNETEVEWEGRADGQELVEPEEPLPFVVLELAPAPRRGLDDHVHRRRASVSHTHSIPFHPSHGPGPPLTSSVSSSVPSSRVPRCYGPTFVEAILRAMRVALADRRDRGSRVRGSRPGFRSNSGAP